MLQRIDEEEQKQDSIPTIYDMLSGSFKFVENLTITMPHPLDQEATLIAVAFTGETFNNVPHGLGEFTWPEGRGFGSFKNGHLQGQALILENEKKRMSLTYRDGVIQGYGKTYFQQNRVGRVNSQER